MAGKNLEMTVAIRGALDGSLSASMRKAVAEAQKVHSQLNGVAKEQLRLAQESKRLQGVEKNAQQYRELMKAAQATSGELRQMPSQIARLSSTYQKSEAETARLKRETESLKAVMAASRGQIPRTEYRKMEADLKALRAAMKQSEAGTRAAGNELARAKAQAASLGSTLQGQRASINDLRESLAQAGFATGDFARSQKRLQAQLRQTAIAAADAAKQQERLSAQEKHILEQQAFQGAREDAEKLRRDANGRALENLYNARGNFDTGRQLVGEVISPFAGATRDAMAFESATADVRKVVDFDTPQQFKEMQQDILALTQTLPMTGEEIAAIVAAGGQAGIARKDLMLFAESAAKMGVAFDITADQAGDMMAKWRTAFKMSQAEVVGLADKINYLGNTTAASAPLISDVVNRIGPLGEVGGLASGEIAALGASMVSAGVAPEIAATGIKNMMLSMVAGESATKSQAEAFAQLGMNATDVARRMQTDATGAITDLMKALGNLDEYKRASVLQSIFGKESIGPISTLLNNLPALQDNLRKVGDASRYAGSMDAEYAARIATTESQMRLAEGAVKAVSIEIGNAFLPVVQQAAQWVAENVAELASWIRENRGAAQWAGILAAAVSAVVMTALTIQMAVAGWKLFASTVNLVTHSTMLSTAAQKIMAGAMTVLRSVVALNVGIFNGLRFAVWALNAAFYANPIGAVIGLVIALGAAAYMLISHFEEVKAFMTRVWESPIAAALAFIAGPVGLLIYAASGIIANWDSVKTALTNAWNDPAGAIAGFKALAMRLIDQAVQYIMKRWETLKNALAHPLDAVVNLVTTGSVAGESASSAEQVQAAQAGASVGSFQQVQEAMPQVAELGRVSRESAAETAANADALQQYRTAVETGGQDMGAYTQLVRQSGEGMNLFKQGMEAGNPLLTQQNELLGADNQLMVQHSETLTANSDSMRQFGDAAISAAHASNSAASAMGSLGEAVMGAINAIRQAAANAASVKGVEVAHNAAGGIYGKGAFLTTFAESSPEAAIPLDGSSRAVSLWQRAGQMLGVMPETAPGTESGMLLPLPAGSSSMGVTLEFHGSPITINGNADSIAIAEIRAELERQKQEFQRMVERAVEQMNYEQRRISYV